MPCASSIVCTATPPLPHDVMHHILAWIPPKAAWKLRRVCRNFSSLIASKSFAAANLRRFASTTGHTESVKTTQWDLLFFKGPISYQQVYARDYLSGKESIEWNSCTKNMYTQATLNAAIPHAIGFLKSLVTLNLRGCGLLGAIPIEIGGLERVEVLNLSFNKLSGAIPLFIGGLSRLMQLNLACNGLSGAIPAELGQLSRLVLFSIQDNSKICGELPPQLGNLRMLEYLNISNTSVSGEIPSEWGQLRNLKTLYLARNTGLTSRIPVEFGQLASLVYMDLSENSLSGCIPRELGGLLNLQILWLKSNRLSGQVPVELASLGNENQLRSCDLSGNPGLVCSFEFASRDRVLSV
ncbi:hypothetical protein HDU98_004374 [Podochytrium sp. JEL0797]|nr:hypothetical protein HDU98_004374 [Podochytrium sp. JEL0797]